MWPKKDKRHFRLSDSERALNNSLEDLHEIKARGPEVENVVTDMLELRKRNHFAQQLSLIVFRHQRRLQ